MSQGAERPFTLLLVPFRDALAGLPEVPPWLSVAPHRTDLEADPLAWLDKKGTFTLLELRVREGHLDKRRGWAGRLEPDDPEQQEAAAALIRHFLELTNRRWVAYANWTGSLPEIREVSDVPVEAGLRVPAEPDRIFRFWRPYRYGDIE